MKNKNFLALLLFSFLGRLLLSSFIELNNDEVYYWTYAQKLQWNYFDHPPGIAILLRLFTINLFLQHEFFLRLGPICCSAISTCLIYLIGKRIKDDTTGFIAALLFTASPYCSIIAGLLVIPDAPQLVFWLASVLLMLIITEPNIRRRKLRSHFLLLGLSIGCCMLCKVHGAFLWFGFLLYIICFQRKLLSNPFLFYAGFTSVVLFSPVIFWNISNDFISYKYHSDRVSFFSAIHLEDFVRELGGEVLYNNPIVFVMVVIILIAIVKRKRFMQLPQQRLLLMIALPMIVSVLFMALFRETLPHWTGPAYATLLPVVGAYLVHRRNKKTVPVIAKWALGFTLALLLPLLIIIRWLPYNIGDKRTEHLGEGDPTLDMSGFKQFGQRFDSVYQSDVSIQRIHKDAFLLSDFWFPAAHIDYYLARPAKINFMAVGSLTAIHHYAWLNKERPPLYKGADAYYITISNYFHPLPENLAKHFQKILPADTIVQRRGGVPVRNFFVYRLVNCDGNVPADGVLY